MVDKLLFAIRDYFGLTQKQARGFVVMMLLVFVFMLAPFVYRRWSAENPPPITANESKKYDSILAALEAIQPVKPRYPNYNGKADEANPERSLALFYFDPNKITIEQWQDLGLRKYMAERIIKYRSKGGVFRKKEDLLHIYSFPTEVYERIEPYITLQKEQLEARNTEKMADARTYSKSTFMSKKPVFVVFDINTTDTTELIKLYGIGSKSAERIIKLRDGLGGFVSQDQYGDVFGIDSLAMIELKKYAQVQSPVRRVSVNTATAEVLDKHQYITAKQAAVIVAYRQQHGDFKSAGDLLKIKILKPETVKKLEPYLEF